MPLVASYGRIQPTLPIALVKAQQNSHGFPFKFSCNLAGHPLFQIPRLVQLMDLIASQTPSQVTCVATGKRSSNSNWSGRIHPERFAEIINHTEETGFLILIKDAQKDPEYQALLDQIVYELENLTGEPLRQQQTWIEAYVFIAPPNTTNSHSKREANFLFQVHEGKQILHEKSNHSIFISFISSPGKDRTVSLNLFLVEPTVSKDKVNVLEEGQSSNNRLFEKSRSPCVGAKHSVDRFSRNRKISPECDLLSVVKQH